MSRSRRWYLALSTLLVGAFLFAALFPDWLTAVSPYYTDTRPTVLEGRPPFPPGPAHPLGSDALGRDVWSRVVYGTRWSLLFAVLIMAGRLLLAVPMGVAAIYGPRVCNWLVERLYVFSSAIPSLLIYLLVLSVGSLRLIPLTPSVMLTIALTTLVEWPRIALFIKGRLNELSAEQFVEGAVAAGARPGQIFWHHLMPHLWPNLVQVAAAEMGRALLTVAQLGIFGIWIGGGIMELGESAGGPPVFFNTTGIPEWGTLLADSRRFIRTAPWIPMAPATAFLLAVAGFNLLSQGLEGVTFGLNRWKEATTGRLSARWRWVLLPLALAAGLGITALSVHDPDDGRRNEPRGGLTSLRGYFVDTYADFNPVDNSRDAAYTRYDVRRVSTAADRAYRLVSPYFPDVDGPRPEVVLYPSHEAYLAAASLRADSPQAQGLIRYFPDHAVRVSPDSINTLDVWDFDRLFAYEMIKALTETRLHQGTGAPIPLGLYDRKASLRNGVWWLDFSKLKGAPLKELRELYATPLAELTPDRFPAYLIQSVLLADLLEQKGLSPEAMLQHGTNPDGLAAALGTTVEALENEYATYVRQRVGAQSILLRPEWRAEIPMALTDAVAARGAAAGAETVVLDARVKEGKATLLVMEHAGNQTAVVVQEWAEAAADRWEIVGTP